MKPGMIVKLCKRLRAGRQRFRVYHIGDDGYIYMTGLDDGIDYFAKPHQLTILGGR